MDNDSAKMRILALHEKEIIHLNIFCKGEVINVAIFKDK
ncbi:hypothetical protein ADIMK_0437 [Marinobacterium lacunae]|uniref:Uncharacterized protein n=1 Tax=Marinobacterium lacunae TaxID=1232683 RepID=A0A081G3X5_9GAMM|nr:hypothetical protein ADIMK_0437 [Marinobacterium lacunae]